jgi:predicted RNA-binding protein with PIN domain
MPPLYLIDGYNFLHAVVLKGRERAAWWSPENQARAVARVAGLVSGEGVETWVVFDRRGPADAEAGAAFVEPEEGLQVHHAPDADDYIVAWCAELSALRDVIVVSADRSLVDRARYRGARRLSPWAFVRPDARAEAVRARGSSAMNMDVTRGEHG